MRHAMFQDYRTLGSTEEDFSIHVYGHGSHLGHVTKTIFKIDVSGIFPVRLRKRFGFDWPSGFREKDVSKKWS